MSPVELYPDGLFPSEGYGLYPSSGSARTDEIGLDLYEDLRPIADPYDAERGYPLFTWALALGRMFQPTYDLVKDPSIYLDPNRTPASWLPWLGQFVGERISGPGAGESDSQFRTRAVPLIQNPPSARRGTVGAIVEEVQKFLNPPQTVITSERVGGHWCVGTIAIPVGLRKTGVTLDQIQLQVNHVKAAGRQITVSEVTGSDWQTLKDTHTSWQDVKDTFSSWTQVFENPGLT